MRTFELKGQVRPSVGKKASKELRKHEQIPCVLYGGEKNIHFFASEPEFRHLIYTPHVYCVNIEIEGAVYQAILQEIQTHPVTDKVLHIDFLQIFPDKKLQIKIPLVLTGVAKGVLEGGKLYQGKRLLKVRGLLKDIPETIEVDVTNLSVAKTIKIGEVQVENIELFDPKNTVIASVQVTRASKTGEGAVVDETAKPASGAAKPAAAAAKPAEAAKPAAKGAKK